MKSNKNFPSIFFILCTFLSAFSFKNKFTLNWCFFCFNSIQKPSKTHIKVAPKTKSIMMNLYLHTAGTSLRRSSWLWSSTMTKEHQRSSLTPLYSNSRALSVPNTVLRLKVRRFLLKIDSYKLEKNYGKCEQCHLYRNKGDNSATSSFSIQIDAISKKYYVC